MGQKSPRYQLMDLCTGYGAVPEKIEQQAPFLLTLPATLHAHEALGDAAELDVAEAARALLVCVTKPGGAAGLDEHGSEFVVACLALDGALHSLQQRMETLVALGDGRYPTSKNTLTKQREIAMANLAGVLRALERYPCAPRSGKERMLDTAMQLIAVVRLPDYYSQDPDGLREMRDEFFKEFSRAFGILDDIEPGLNAYQRLNVMVTAVAARTYRAVYDELKPRSIELLVEPELVPRLFEDRPFPTDRDAPAVVRTLRILVRLFRDIEERDAWEQALVASAEAGAFELSLTQMLRVRANFEQFSDPA